MKKNPWLAQKEVSLTLARRLIQAQFRELSPARLEVLGEGWDNKVFRVNEQYVFRFPRRQMAVDLVQIEQQVLPVVAPHLPIPTPVPRFSGKPTEEYPWPFCGYPFLPGQAACYATFDDNQRIALATPLAHFFRSLHSIAKKHIALSIPSDELARLDIDSRMPTIAEHLQQLGEAGLIADEKPFRQVIERAKQYKPMSRALVHGDFDARHLLVDDQGNATGVIDWGDVHWGDPAVDLAIVCSFLPPAGRKIFCQSYGQIAESTWRLAKFRALFKALVLISYGQSIGDDAIVREEMTSLSHIIS